VREHVVVFKVDEQALELPAEVGAAGVENRHSGHLVDRFGLVNVSKETRHRMDRLDQVPDRRGPDVMHQHVPGHHLGLEVRIQLGGEV